MKVCVFMRGSRYIKKTFYIIRRYFKPGAVILLYHRVIRIPTDPYNLVVSPEHFSQHMEYLRRTCCPMRLHDLVEAMCHHMLPDRAVAITFDDGYADNYWHARPVLESAKIPATIFVTSDHVDSNYEYWWDDLERIFSLPLLSPTLLIRTQDRFHEWHINSPAQLEQTRKEIFTLMRLLDSQAREGVVDQLACWAGIERTGRADYRAVTATQLRDLACSEYVEIGAHTRTHPRLSILSPDAQRAEIVGGREVLESVIQRPVDMFAYPYGDVQDFNDETIRIVRTAGFRAATTIVSGSVESGDDLFRLRRCAVYDWGLDIFQKKLESFFVDRG